MLHGDWHQINAFHLGFFSITCSADGMFLQLLLLLFLSIKDASGLPSDELVRLIEDPVDRGDAEDDSGADARLLSGVTNTTTSSSTSSTTFTISWTSTSTSTASSSSSTSSTATSSTATTATTTSSTATVTTKTTSSSTATVTSVTSTTTLSNTTTQTTQTTSSSTGSSTTSSSSSSMTTTSISTTNTTTSMTVTQTTTYTGVWYEILGTAYVGFITGNAYTIEADTEAMRAAAAAVGALTSIIHTSAELRIPEEGSTFATLVITMRAFRRTLDLARSEATRLTQQLDELTPGQLTTSMARMDSLKSYVFQCTDLTFSMEILYPEDGGIEVYRSVDASTSSTEPPELIQLLGNASFFQQRGLQPLGLPVGLELHHS
eukprot:s1673_g13.t1